MQVIAVLNQKLMARKRPLPPTLLAHCNWMAPACCWWIATRRAVPETGRRARGQPDHGCRY